MIRSLSHRVFSEPSPGKMRTSYGVALYSELTGDRKDIVTA
jgi:hypothetical protein